MYHSFSGTAGTILGGYNTFGGSKSQLINLINTHLYACGWCQRRSSAYLKCKVCTVGTILDLRT